MLESSALDEVLQDTIALLKGIAGGPKRTVTVSPEVAALLESIPARSAAAPRVSVPAAVPAQKPSSAPPVIAVLAQPVADREGRPAELALVAEEVRTCTKCGLCKTRKNTVFGVGNPHAELVFVGEAPGADEDRQGIPFVGRAGQLLTDIIVKGMKLRREDVYICNVLKCRPPENRDPNLEEVYNCEPYLLRQLDVIRPKAICALGRIAAQTLLKTTDSTGKLRGKWHNYHGIPLRVTYHPAYLLRSPGEKAKAWADVQEIMKLLKGEITPEI